jgi:putative transposase
MRRDRFKEEQIIAVLREAESGTQVKELCRRADVSTVTFYKWKTKYAGMEISEGASDASSGGRKCTAEEDRDATGAGY